MEGSTLKHAALEPHHRTVEGLKKPVIEVIACQLRHLIADESSRSAMIMRVLRASKRRINGRKTDVGPPEIKESCAGKPQP